MPKDLLSQRTWCLEWIKRPPPMASPHASYDEGGNTKDAAESAAGLLGLANNFIGVTDEDA